MHIQFKFLNLRNFKSHKDLRVDFDDITSISGNNGMGKSTISEAITFILYGVDPMGSKMDPTPITYLAAESQAELLVSVDGKDILLGRGVEKGKAKYYINEVPEKATPFDDLVKSLFDKELFLSIFNPGYFFTQHWEKQRAQLLQYVAEPTNAEVLKELTELDRTELGELLKKKSLDEIDKIHRDNKTRMEKTFQQKTGSVETLDAQLAKAISERDALAITETIQELSEKNADLKARMSQHSQMVKAAQDKESLRTKLAAQFDAKKEMYLKNKADYERFKVEPLADTCNTCGQSLPDEALEQVKDYRAQTVQTMAEGLKVLAETCKSLQSQLKELGEQVHVESLGDLAAQHQEVHNKLTWLERIQDAESDLIIAKREQEEARDSMNHSTVLVDAVKAFRAKQAELMAGKVSSLFQSLSIRLFDVQKNGEIKPTFEIEMDGKPYSKLSTAEKIIAGLELIDVLGRQSGLVAPTFIDNVESIMRFTKPSGQLITARAVDGPFDIKLQTLKEEVVNG